MSAALQPGPSPRAARDGFRSTGPGFVGSRGCRADNLVLRLADEGVPMAPIARIVQRPMQRVMSIVERALGQGLLAVAPPMDWPEGEPTRPERLTRDADLLACAERFVAPIMAAFEMPSRQQALFIALLVCEGVVARPTLGRLLGVRRQAARETVDKVASVARSTLAEHRIGLITVYGQGFSLSESDRTALLKLLATVPSAAPALSGNQFLAALADERRSGSGGAPC